MGLKVTSKLSNSVSNKEISPRDCHYIKVGYTDSFVREEEAIDSSGYFTNKKVFDEFEVFKKIIITSLSIVLLLLTASLTLNLSNNLSFAETGDPIQNKSGFFDVASNHWALPFISSLKSSEIITGYTDGTFKPQANVKINEFIAMTVKALGYRFESMSSDWAKPYVDKAIELKIIQDQEFPSYGAQINREQMTSIVINAVSLSEYRPSNTMDLYIRNETRDFHLVGDYYKQNVLDSYKFGIITGFSDKTFRPKNFSTRAEASAVLSNLLNKNQRKPFVKTDARYTMFPVSQLDEFGNEETVEQALYAPLLNGKPVNEIIDVAEILKTVAKQQDKSYLHIGTTQLSQRIGITGLQSKEYYDSANELIGYERAITLAQRADFGFVVQLDDLSNKFNPYYLGMNKKHSLALNDPLFSTYFFRHYEDQLKPVFQYLFEDDFDRAWSLLKTGLDDKGSGKTTQLTLNGRFVSLVSSYDAINLTISLKK